MAGDAYWSNVSLLLHGETLVDSSPTPKTLTAFGSFTISGTQKKFGGGALKFDVGGYIETPNSSAFDMGTGDFTVEGWIYVPSGVVHTDNFVPVICAGRQDTSSGGGGWNVAMFDIAAATMRLEKPNTNGTAVSYSFPLGSALPKDVWLHVAVARASGVTYGFASGALLGSTSTFGGVALPVPNNLSVMVGSGGSLSQKNYWANKGYIDDLRITKGVARYTANFTPPTAPFPDGVGQVSGAVAANGAAAVRTVRAYRRDTGALVANVTSDAAGAYSFYTPTLDEVSVICLDDDAGTLENDKILRVIPA